MDGTIDYLNTDLVLVSSADLTSLVSAFEAGGVRPLYGVTRGEDGRGYVTFETSEPHAEPESNIAAMLAVIESLSADLQAVWEGCSRREFDVGYDCGWEPWAFAQGLSPRLLGRMAAAGTSLRITIYPYREPSRVS